MPDSAIIDGRAAIAANPARILSARAIEANPAKFRRRGRRRNDAGPAATAPETETPKDD